jgi:hypothetical protein
MDPQGFFSNLMDDRSIRGAIRSTSSGGAFARISSVSPDRAPDSFSDQEL